MTIYKTNKNLPNSDRIDLINNMVMELNGLVDQGKFDINELTQIYSDLVLNREFNRNITLGHSLITYGGWTHLKAEDGYSIWKYVPTDYIYNSVNSLYFDNIKLENRGETDAEAATGFDLVYTYDAEGSGGGEYIDNTTEAAIETGIAFDMMDTTSDYVYLGEASTFSAAKFEWATRGSYYTLKIEYYNGTSGDGWEEITTELDGLSDDTSNFESDGRISWNIPGDWATTAVNGETKYWIRISTTTTPVTVAMCYYLIPGNSVIATLALSSTELQNEDWAWCSYSGNVYVTIRNTGNVNYEGNYYLTSASSTSNKQNFFIYNHEYKADYQDTTYSSTKTQYRTTFTDVDLESGGILTVTHSLNSQYNIVAIYNNSDIVVLPDSIVATDANNTSIDLSSQGTLTGTWNLVILA